MFRNNELKKFEASLYDDDYRLDKTLSCQQELELSLGQDMEFWNTVNSSQPTPFFSTLQDSTLSFFANNEKTRSSDLTSNNQAKIKPTKSQQSAHSTANTTSTSATEEKHSYNLRHAPNKYIPR